MNEQLSFLIRDEYDLHLTKDRRYVISYSGVTLDQVFYWVRKFLETCKKEMVDELEGIWVKAPERSDIQIGRFLPLTEIMKED